MAIIPTVPAFSATILINGKTVDEYQPPHIPIPHDPGLRPELPRTRCFIKAETGHRYSIRYRVSPLFNFAGNTDVLVVSIYIDGNLVEKSCVPKDILGSRDFIEEIDFRHKELPDGSFDTHAFVFQDLSPAEGTDAATLKADLQRVKALGTIKIVLSLAKENDTDDTQVHEPVEVEYISSDTNETIGCFYFFYLSQNSLESHRINDPSFINHSAHGVAQTLAPALAPSRYPIKTLANGRLEIDLTGDDG
ncbi:hypothetical protein FBEOM_12354 [Fusarium beomiforme]|uniref:DUF7918 domain-containing protein n=1 Tax=Fusarium beomiforme TaxID=44412 RepID=A0A9P5DT45_9HYPO|nr:hypothetical protein FBEOM_12354 [Fusarium beomiforme]